MSDYWPVGMTLRVILPSSVLKDAPLYWFLRDLEALRVTTKLISRYQYDNNHQRLSLDAWGAEFSFLISGPQRCALNSPRDQEFLKLFGNDGRMGANVFEISLWDNRGVTAIHQERFVAKELLRPIPGETVARCLAKMQTYAEGSLECSDCHALLPMAELPGHYFAGRYCSPCWLGARGENAGKGGWKAVEARETYE